MHMSVQVIPERSILVVKPEGEIDLYSASEFAKETLGRIGQGLKAVVADFSEVSYLDSSGTGAVIRIFQRTRSLGIKFILAGLRRGPRQILEMVNLLSIIPASPSIEEALRSLGG
jgi:anti-anti-sigma factor